MDLQEELEAVTLDLLELRLEHMGFILRGTSTILNYEFPQIERLISIKEMKQESIRKLIALQLQLDTEFGVMETTNSKEEDSTNSNQVSDLNYSSDSETSNQVVCDVESQSVESIPMSTEDGSLDFELIIPSFLFEEEIDVPLDTVPLVPGSTTELTQQSSISSLPDAGIYQTTSKTHFYSAVGANPHNKYLKKFFFHHNKLLSLDCFSLYPDASRSIFDRGKRIPISFNSNEKLIISWNSSLGYQLDFSCIHSTVRLCINDAAILNASKLFDKMSDSLKLSSVGVAFVSQLKLGKVFDRGKGSANSFVLGSILLEIYNGGLVFELTELFPRHEYQGLSSSVDAYEFDFGLPKSGSHVLACTAYYGGNFFYLYFVYTCCLFDRGKGFDRSISISYDIERFAHELNRDHGFGSHPLFCALILLELVTTSDLGKTSKIWAAVVCIKKALKWSVQVGCWKGAEIFFLPITRKLLDTIVAQIFFLLPPSTGSFIVYLFRVIIDRKEGDMHQIFLQELHNFSVPLFLVHTIINTCLSPSRIDPFQHSTLLTSELFWRFMLHERVLLTVAHFIWSSLHMSYGAGCFPFCFRQVNILLHSASKFLVFHYHSLNAIKLCNESLQQGIRLCLLHLNLSKWLLHLVPIQSYHSVTDTKNGREILQATFRIMIQQGVRQFILSSLHLNYFSCYFSNLGGGLSVHYLFLATKVLFLVVEILTVLFRIEFLRWKYKLFSTFWWRNRSCKARIRNLIVGNDFSKLICVLVEKIAQFEFLFFVRLLGRVMRRRNCGAADIFLQLELGMLHTSQDSYDRIQARVGHPVPIIISSQCYCWKISPFQRPRLLTSAVFRKFVLQNGLSFQFMSELYVKKRAIHLSIYTIAATPLYISRISSIYWRTFYWDPHISSCYNQLLRAYGCNSTQYPHWCYKYLWEFPFHDLPTAAQVFPWCMVKSQRQYTCTRRGLALGTSTASDEAVGGVPEVEIQIGSTCFV